MMFSEPLLESPMTSRNNHPSSATSADFRLDSVSGLPMVTTSGAASLPLMHSELPHPTTPGAATVRKEVIHSYFETADASDGGESPIVTDSESDLDEYEVDSDSNSPPSVLLHPFQNQVGGHASLLRFSPRALCKPLMAHEKAMYEHFESEHPEILPFTSSYLGVLNVTFENEKDKVVPVVLFEKNRHILPDDILKRFIGTRMDLNQDKILESPGVTKVNKKLQEQIFHEACSPKSIRGRIRSLSAKKRMGRRRPKQSLRRHSFSESTIADTAKPDSNACLLQVKECESRFGASFESDRPPYDTSDDDSIHHGVGKSSPLLTSSKNHFHRHQNSSLPLPPSRGGCPSSSNDESFLFPMEDIEEALPETPISVQSPTPLNPWQKEIYQSTIEKMTDASALNTVHQFMLLNDLTYKMVSPCILDLKMGTRQYGIYATKDKRDSQMKKCEKSTSKALGVRVCGMQIYKAIEKKYIFHDKYYGRKLSGKGFRQSLIDYLHDGEKLLVHLLPNLVHKLRNLFDIIRSLPGYRFYASSLLLLYDGEPTSPLHSQIDIKIIDFANCVHPAMVQPELPSNSTYPSPNFPPSSYGPDHGYLRGIATLLQEFAELWYLHASPEDQERYHNEMLVDKEFPDAY